MLITAVMHRRGYDGWADPRVIDGLLAAMQQLIFRIAQHHVDFRPLNFCVRLREK